jgi:hypothetical protein
MGGIMFPPFDYEEYDAIKSELDKISVEVDENEYAEIAEELDRLYGNEVS